MSQQYVKITEWIKMLTGLEADTQTRIWYTFLLLVILLLLKYLVRQMIWKRTDDPEKRYFSGKLISYTFAFLAVLVLLRIWVDASGSLMNIFALISAALTISLQDLIKTLAGWLYLISRKPFKVGDRIMISGFSGDVIDINPFQFTLNEIGNWAGGDQSTGRVIHLPNNMILSQPVTNCTEDFAFIWSELSITLTFDSNWKKAKEMLQNILDEIGTSSIPQAEKALAEAGKKYMLLYRKLTPIVYTSVKSERGIVLSARFLVEPRRRRDAEQEIWEKLLDRINGQADITLIR